MSVHEYMGIKMLYDKAMKAKKKGDLEKAAHLFKSCHQSLQEAELSFVWDDVIKKTDDAYKQYNKITKKIAQNALNKEKKRINKEKRRIRIQRLKSFFNRLFFRKS